MSLRPACLAVLLLVLVAGGVRAGVHTAEPVLLRADEVRHDDRAGVTTARGSVEFASGGYVLRADRVVYDHLADHVSAAGNVILVDAEGQTIHSDHVEITGDMREGVIEGFRMLLSDGARIAAIRAERTAGGSTVAERAVYSPCSVCPDDSERPPLWQLKARRIIHDRETRDVTYRDVVLEIFGIPVAYSPFVRHPDPTVTRRSGFLAPDIGSSSTLGSFVSVPYYLDLAPWRGVTIEPIITGKEGVILTGEFRERMEAGAITVDGSVTRARARHHDGVLKDGRETRWHVDASGLWNDGADLLLGADIHRASDDTYLSRYGFSDDDTLVSDVFVEHFDDRTYTAASAWLYQGLRPSDDPGNIPLVAPLVTYSYRTPPSSIGASASVDAGLLALSRSGGRDSRRLSGTVAWQAPIVTPGGQVYTARLSLRGDAYHTSGIPPGDRTAAGWTGRAIPEGVLEWRLPLVRTTAAGHQFIEPLVMAAWSPNGGNDDGIPNEDGQDFEFDEMNLFSTNRFSGLDRVEGGLRLNYGLRLGDHSLGGGRNELLVGQSWRKRDDATFDENQGFEGRFSDYVGRLLVNPHETVNLLYRFRVSSDFSNLYRSEFASRFGTAQANAEFAYVRLGGETDSLVGSTGTRQQVAGRGQLTIGGYWTLEGAWRSDLEGGETVVFNGALTYRDECIEISLRGERRSTDYTDYEPKNVIGIKVRLLTLG